MSANQFISAGGYLGLFLLGIFAESVFLGATEPAVIGLWTLKFNIILVIAVATLGNLVGAFLNYYLGMVGERYWLRKKIVGKWVERAKSMFTRYGAWILLFNWLPFIGDPLTIVAGLMKYDLKKFTLYVLLGKLFRYVGLYLIFDLFY
jgi:membrane protein YqaA with SNARE-associated domain